LNSIELSPNPIRDLLGCLQGREFGAGDASVLQTFNEEDAAKQPMPIPTMRGHIKFENVTFRHPTRADKNALQNINLEISPGLNFCVFLRHWLKLLREEKHDQIGEAGIA